ncbi:IclR family transcriptional regulator [Acidimangrovimonas sediminis]|uniref:IclR family transcriptional regulator n=1 Tax=Acidimangrovimonas sediminis TaxID=2056283 RepID=UPI000C8024F8|nr:IclR family transcriptional regulator [Acidimangrovimonas sediminis]
MKSLADGRGEAAEKDKAPSGVLERTLSILELLARNARGLQIFEIADTLGIPRSATHRLLTSLVEHGYVKQEREHGAYLLTARIVSLAFTFLSGSGITDLAQPIIDQLAQRAGELVRLAIVDGDQLTWVAKAQGSPHGLRYDPETGQVARLSCSASGLAWLSTLDEDEAISLVEKQGFGSREQYGPNAPQTRAELLELLRLTRRRGYSETVQTYYDWMSSIAAPIPSPNTGETIGTLVVAGPSMRLTEEKRNILIPDLLETARELSQALLVSATLARPQRRAANFFNADPEL